MDIFDSFLRNGLTKILTDPDADAGVTTIARLFVAKHKKEGGQKALELRSGTMSWEDRARGCEGWDSRVK
jgi:hypothetical protein